MNKKSSNLSSSSLLRDKKDFKLIKKDLFHKNMSEPRLHTMNYYDNQDSAY